MAAHQQGDQLVAQLLIRGRTAALVALLEQQREHRLTARLGPPARQQVKQQLVEVRDRQPKAAPRAAGPQIALHDGHRQHPRQRTNAGQCALDGVVQLPGLRISAGAEDHAQDDLQRELAHPLQRAHAAVPRAQLALRQLGDHGRKRPHARAVKRRLHQSPLAQMLLPVE